mmetsp:Transcript_658/g.970  ORF Transcript_658/g.970 Transcript_658/m.970 type:complete len:93 (-) Transcript_658:208-486(-)
MVQPQKWMARHRKFTNCNDDQVVQERRPNIMWESSRNFFAMMNNDFSMAGKFLSSMLLACLNEIVAEVEPKTQCGFGKVGAQQTRWFVRDTC